MGQTLVFLSETQRKGCVAWKSLGIRPTSIASIVFMYLYTTGEPSKIENS